MFLNEVRNHAFEAWAAGAPDSYSQQITQTAILQLQNSWLRGHPARLTMQSEAIGARGPFVYELPNSYRATLAAAAVVEDWRIWPTNALVGNAFSVAHLGPYQVIAGVNDTIVFDIGAGVLTATLTAGFYNATTLIAEIDTQMTAASGGAYTITFDGINRTVRIVQAAGVLNIDWATSLASGMLGFTANDTAALDYTSDVPSPANMRYRAWEGKQYAFSVVARCNVDGNLLRVRVIGLDENYVIATYLNANGVWQAGAAQRTFQLSSQWRSLGVNFEAPPSVRYFLWQVSNGTAGAQVIDLGRFWWQHPMWQMGGEEARV